LKCRGIATSEGLESDEVGLEPRDWNRNCKLVKCTGALHSSFQPNQADSCSVELTEGWCRAAYLERGTALLPRRDPQFTLRCRRWSGADFGLSCEREASRPGCKQAAGASGASPGASPRIILEFDVLDVREGASRLRQGASGASRKSKTVKGDPTNGRVFVEERLRR
jgi:hypothetical protein